MGSVSLIPGKPPAYFQSALQRLLFNNFGHHLNRAFPVEAFTWPNIQLVGNGIQLFLSV